MFVGENKGKAEEAMDFYISLFKNSGIRNIVYYGSNDNDVEGTIKHAVFLLNGQEFMAMDSSIEHNFNFTPAVSFYVRCKSQEEVDRLWEKLSADPSAEQCGWLKDKYGVSWQIIPTVLEELLSDTDLDKSQRVIKAMLEMKKIDIEQLQKAYQED